MAAVKHFKNLFAHDNASCQLGNGTILKMTTTPERKKAVGGCDLADT